MSTQEQQIAQKIVNLAKSLQPTVSVVGNSLQFTHQGKSVSVPLFGSSTVIRDRSGFTR